jgi:hypothetical protein
MPPPQQYTRSSRDIESYNSTIIVPGRPTHHLGSVFVVRRQRHRIVMFALLVFVSITCVFMSYLVSSVSKPACSDRIIWMPDCNREEY